MKGKVGTEMSKEQEAYGTPMPQQPATTVMMPHQPVEQADHAAATCWYVFGILASILCCLPCGVIGLVHAMIAKHEGERGNLQAHKRRMYQAKCWTSWSIALGVVLLILVIVAGVVSTYMVDWNSWYDDYDYGDLDKPADMPPVPEMGGGDRMFN